MLELRQIRADGPVYESIRRAAERRQRPLDVLFIKGSRRAAFFEWMESKVPSRLLAPWVRSYVLRVDYLIVQLAVALQEFIP